MDAPVKDSEASAKDALVLFMPSGKRGHFPVGTTVLEAARTLGVYVESVCGGRGICGRCQIDVQEGRFAKHGITSSNDHISEFGPKEKRYAEKRDLKDAKLWDEVMGINVTANYRLIRSLDPLLRAADAGRVVLVTSGLAHKCWPYWGPYSISKAALEAMAKVYAGETATTAVRVNCFSPGPTRTKMRATAMPGEDPETLPSAEEVAAQMVAMCTPAFTDTGTVWKYASTGLFKQFG